MAFNENKPVHNSDLSSSEIRENFKHLKQALSKEHAWNDSNPASSTHRLDQMKISVGGSQQGATRSWGGFSKYGHNKNDIKDISLGLVETNSGLGAGNYTLQNILQHLVNCSHSHYMTTVSMNCNCNCDCNGNN